MQTTTIQSKIYEIRGIKVMLDFDLASLYQVPTKSLNLAVKRNLRRFPEDFMFQLEKTEWESLRFQFETSKSRGGRRYLPYVFTEQGVSMLSSIINSDIAIDMNIKIMRTFVYMRQFALSHLELSMKLKELEEKYDQKFNDITYAIEFLLQRDQKKSEQNDRKRIGYKLESESSK